MKLILFTATLAVQLPGDVKNYLSRLFSPENLPNIGLLVAGIIGIIIAIRTLKFLGRQTTAIEKQGDAQINSERAWVIAELVPTCSQIGKGWYRTAAGGHNALSEEEIVEGRYLDHVLKFTNMGRTPAHVLRYHIGYSREADVTGTEIRMIDTVKYPEINFDRLIGGGESVEATDVNVAQYIRDSIKEIGDSNATGILSGWVEYQHVFSDTEIVRVPFVYLYDPAKMRVIRIPLPKPQKGGKK